METNVMNCHNSICFWLTKIHYLFTIPLGKNTYKGVCFDGMHLSYSSFWKCSFPNNAPLWAVIAEGTVRILWGYYLRVGICLCFIVNQYFSFCSDGLYAIVYSNMFPRSSLLYSCFRDKFLVRTLSQNPIIVQQTLKILRLIVNFVKCYQLLVAK